MLTSSVGTLDGSYTSGFKAFWRLQPDGVEFVQFLATSGDAVYATSKPKTGGERAASSSSKTFVRIGEGYSVEYPNGWSSPAFVINAVAKKGVP